VRFRPKSPHPGHLLLLALVLRLCLFPVATYWYDMNAFRSWAHFFSQHPLADFYSADSLGTAPDHLPGDLLIYAGLGRLLGDTILDTTVFPFAIKTIGATTDVSIGLLLWIGARKVAPLRARTVMLCWLFNPAVIFISAIWGQLDALSLLFALAGIVAVLYGRYLLCWTPLAWACLIKPQLAAILPIVLLVILYKEISSVASSQSRNPPTSPGMMVNFRAGIKQFWTSRVPKAILFGWIVALAVVSLICLPFGVGLVSGLGLEWTLLERVQFAMDRHNNMVVGGHTLWSLILGVDAINPDDRIAFAGLTVKNVANILTMTALVGTYGLCLMRRSWQFALAWGCAAATMTMYVLPTRIHERYFLPALLFLILFSAIDRDRRRARVLVTTGTFTFLCSLLVAYTASYPVWGMRIPESSLTLRLLSLGYVSIYAVVIFTGATSPARTTVASRAPVAQREKVSAIR